MLRFSTKSYECLGHADYKHMHFGIYKSPKGAVLIKVYRNGLHIISLYRGLKDMTPRIYFEKSVTYKGIFLTEEEWNIVYMELSVLKITK